MKNGVPFDVAFSLSHVDVVAYGIIFSGFEGHEYDFGTMRWKERK